MNILLLSPPVRHYPGEPKFVSPPLGLAYIAALLEKHGYRPKIIDCCLEGSGRSSIDPGGTRVYGLSYREIVNRVEEYRPAVIGISCIFSNSYPIVEEMAAGIKSRLPKAVVVLGGTHPTVMADEIVSNPNIDFVIRGEGEFAFLKLVEAISGDAELDTVPGLTWSKDGEVVSTPQEFLSDLDVLPFPARHLLDLGGYAKHGTMQGQTGKLRATTMITSRGCPASCVFCSIHSVWGKKYRAHSAEYVLEEMRELRDRFSIDHFVIEDDNFTLNRKRAKRVLRGMTAQGGSSWSAPNGVAIWALDEALVDLIRESQCKWLFLAIESGSQDTLDNIVKKPLKLEKAEEIVRLCAKKKIPTTAFFVIGMPGETMDSIRESMRFAERIATMSISIAIATPYPGTRLHRICKEMGYLPTDFDVTRLMTRVGQITTPEFGPDDLQKIIRDTLLRRSLFHPLGTATRLLHKFEASPMDTVRLVWRRIRSVN